MSWQSPQPPFNPNFPISGTVPPGYPSSSSLPPNYTSQPAGYAGAPAPAGFAGYPSSTSFPPGYPTTSTPTMVRDAAEPYPNSSPYPPGALDTRDAVYPAGGYGGNFSAMPSGPQGYPAQYGQGPAAGSHGMYPSIPPQRAHGVYPSTPASGGYAYAPQEVVGYVFQLTELERDKKKVDFKFSPAMDKYVRGSDHNQEFAGWRTLVYAEQNIQRKVEEDWKMAYLTRKEGGNYGRIEWRFDSVQSGLRVKRLHIQFPTKLYEDGHVHAYVASDRGDMLPIADSDRSQDIHGISGAQRFSIIAELSRGNGEHAWQHAQLFRQTLKPGFFSTDDSHYPFRVLVELE